jgi:Protein of unknown function (DUF2953)
MSLAYTENQKGRAWMEWILIILGTCLFIIIILMFSTVNVALHFVHRNDNSDIQITLRMYRIIKYTLNIPLVQIDAKDHSIKIREEKQASIGQKKEKKKKISFKKIQNQYLSFQKTLMHVQNFYRILAQFLKKIKVSQLEWHSAIGLGEASSSAIAAGTVWGIKGIVLQLINTFFRLKGTPSINVVPVFQGMHSETRLSCMVSFKIGHAIVVMLKILKSWRKSRRSSQVNSEYMTGGV